LTASTATKTSPDEEKALAEAESPLMEQMNPSAGFIHNSHRGMSGKWRRLKAKKTGSKPAFLLLENGLKKRTAQFAALASIR
jgi:hypothetical protein